MSAPAWLAASTGAAGLPGQVNQFLLTHESAWTYAGSSLQAQEAIGSTVYSSTNGLYLAQLFTTGASQTTVGIVNLQISTVGGSPVTATITPLTVLMYATSFGVPTGSPLATAMITEQVVYSSPFWVPVTLNAIELTPSTEYALVVEAAGTSSAYYAWQQSNQVIGALTAPDGTTWSSQGYGLMYQVNDASGASWPPLYLTDDGGARLTTFTYNASGQLTGIAEQVQSQTGTDFLSSRTVTYSNTVPIGVA